MVVLSQSALNQFSDRIQTRKPNVLSAEIPVINLSDPEAKTLLVRACEEFGFFKLVNHGISMELMTKLESEAKKFFSRSQNEKDLSGPPDPFGYGNKKIGLNGDVGWVEYLLLNTNPDVKSTKSSFISQQNPEIIRSAMNYIAAVKKMGCELLELVADGLGIEPRNCLSKLLKDERSDSCFRLNHYPSACNLSEHELPALNGKNLIGFGEHTDPQIISVLRSNNTSGLQICLRDGTWVSVSPDQHSFFINVGDTLQVMTNGRFRSVKHRVLADTSKSRLSMIYFGGPPLSEKIVPLTSLMSKGKESLYKEFTWSEYKDAAYKSRLADNRLGPFEKKIEEKKLVI